MIDSTPASVSAAIGDAYESFCRKWYPEDLRQGIQFTRDAMDLVLKACRETSNAILAVK